MPEMDLRTHTGWKGGAGIEECVVGVVKDDDGLGVRCGGAGIEDLLKEELTLAARGGSGMGAGDGKKAQ
jgi:hypothetical protein